MLEYRSVTTGERTSSRGEAAFWYEEPDFKYDAPNYDKSPGMTPEEVLVWLNVD